MSQSLNRKIDTKKENKCSSAMLSYITWVWKLAISWIPLVLLALVIRILIFEPFYIPSGSMNNTLLQGDYIIAAKYSYGYSKYSLPYNLPLIKDRIFVTMPQRGDLVVFRPPNNMSIRYIKRLIGLPGDHILVKNGQIFINDIPVLKEHIGSYVDKAGNSYTQYIETLPNGVKYLTQFLSEHETPFNELENTKLFIVPENHYFFMGDNRDLSLDSRLDLGFVPLEYFIAKARFIFFSAERLLYQDNIFNSLVYCNSWLKSIRFKRIFKSV